MSAPYSIRYAFSNDEEWLRIRKQGVGASESAVILGVSKWGTPRTVWLDKTSDVVEDIGTDVMEFGHLAEDLIVAFIEAHPERFGWLGRIIPSEGLLQSRQWPWLLGTLDRRVELPDGTIVPLELKSVNDHSAREWAVDDAWDEDDPFGLSRLSRYTVPEKYQVQVQHQMAVTGAPFAYVGVWLGKERIEVIRVERDERFIQEKLVDEVGRFWFDHVQTGLPPAPNIRDDLWSIYPGEQGEGVTADDDMLETAWKWRRASVDKRDAELDRKELGFQLASQMGNATELIHPATGKVIHTLRGQRNNRTTDLARLEAEFPEAYAACVREGSWSRRHRPTKETIDLD